MKNAILAISEKKEILKQIRKELAEKYEVITFNNLLDAIDMVRESDFDLILLDNALEGISVGEAKKKLTSIGKDFITVALVDEINESETKELEKFGIFAYLLKPIKIEDLDAIILPSLYPGELIERELFGYERGAFLGANASKKGLLEEIDGGTVYIEDIAKMDIKVQSRFLKAIEYGEFKRVGGTKVRKSNVRFLVGTDIDLKQETEKGKFRKDLYHRLTALTIEVPPLRERKEDIPVLANYFLNKIVRILHKETPVISGEAMKFLMEYYYPGNIMELKNLIERMALLSKDKILDVEQLPLEIKTKSDIVENKTVVGVGPLKEILEQEIYSLEEVERVVIAIALQKTRWNKQETSKILGIGRTTLYEKIRKYGLDTK